MFRLKHLFFTPMLVLLQIFCEFFIFWKEKSISNMKILYMIITLMKNNCFSFYNEETSPILARNQIFSISEPYSTHYTGPNINIFWRNV
ncbi:Protein CBG27613 [Caenorhabditis briggsae]|uniref:Protein CBG27613 n=1 Tax=Caenorhabditis briggsae TaxID=6238 RepID=B6IJ58_CAEBR|nr:Protein CBG27613 [Caenorhabditis briggsae]CAR99892.1 Protein CBG27613 [Caenorhabditis briggsae]